MFLRYVMCLLVVISANIDALDGLQLKYKTNYEVNIQIEIPLEHLEIQVEVMLSGVCFLLNRHKLLN